jgi:hypothetical protein
MIAFVLGAATLSSAVAQSWQEYAYPNYAFSVAFPASPKVEDTTYQLANGSSVPARVYSVTQNEEVFKFTVADLANTGLDEKAVIDRAIKTLSSGGKMTFNVWDSQDRAKHIDGSAMNRGGRAMAHVADHLSIVELEERYRSCTDACSARHFQTTWLLAQGHTIEEAAGTTCFVPRWIEELLARYNAVGPQALGDLRRNGAPPSDSKVIN